MLDLIKVYLKLETTTLYDNIIIELTESMIGELSNMGIPQMSESDLDYKQYVHLIALKIYPGLHQSFKISPQMEKIIDRLENQLALKYYGVQND